jgi:hypothetical protein
MHWQNRKIRKIGCLQRVLYTGSEGKLPVLRSQIVTLKRGGHSKYLPFAFTEQGVAMLSGILNSDRAIQVNIAIMRAFVQLRRFLESNKELAISMEELEKAVARQDEKINLIFQAIKQLIEKKDEPATPRKPVGYKVG